MSAICGVPVGPYVPRGRNTTLGAISGVGGDLSDDDLMEEMSASKNFFMYTVLARPTA